MPDQDDTYGYTHDDTGEWRTWPAPTTPAPTPTPIKVLPRPTKRGYETSAKSR